MKSVKNLSLSASVVSYVALVADRTQKGTAFRSELRARRLPVTLDVPTVRAAMGAPEDGSQDEAVVTLLSRVAQPHHTATYKAYKKAKAIRVNEDADAVDRGERLPKAERPMRRFMAEYAEAKRTGGILPTFGEEAVGQHLGLLEDIFDVPATTKTNVLA